MHPRFVLSPDGQALIEGCEIYSSRACTCRSGRRVIGFGHVIKPHEGHLHTATLTLNEARALLREDAAAVQIYLNGTLGEAGLRQYHFDALVSFCLDVGLGAFDRSNMRVRLRFGDKAGAAGEFDKWVFFRGARLPELVIRRRCERLMFDGVSGPGVEAERRRLQSMKGPL